MQKQKRQSANMLQFLMHGIYPEDASKQDKEVIRKHSKHYRTRDGQLYKQKQTGRAPLRMQRDEDKYRIHGLISATRYWAHIGY